MDIRKSAADLTAGERDKFIEAVVRLKHHRAAGAPAGVSIYDQFIALHGAVFAVKAPDLAPGETVNFGHWNIGFCPWHRQYLRVFERALQAEVPGVTLPYWNWADHVGATNKLFIPEFLGALRSGVPGPVIDCVFRNPLPAPDRPAWWPEGVSGYPIHARLADQFGRRLARGSAGVGWPPSKAAMTTLSELVIEQPGVHPLWYFWTVVEQGYQQVAAATHNRAHNFIGGHMSGGFSPNDPVFWLNHANVDRLWAEWQAKRLNDLPGSAPADHWPPPDEPSPFDGEPAPVGHRLPDAMWPWVGSAPGYEPSVSAAIAAMLPDFSDAPPVRVADVLDTASIDAVGYKYAAPSA